MIGFTGFRVRVQGFRVLGFRVVGFRGLWLRVWGLGFRVLGVQRFRDSGPRTRFRISGLGLRIWVSGSAAVDSDVGRHLVQPTVLAI